MQGSGDAQGSGSSPIAVVGCHRSPGEACNAVLFIRTFSMLFEKCLKLSCHVCSLGLGCQSVMRYTGDMDFRVKMESTLSLGESSHLDSISR